LPPPSMPPLSPDGDTDYSWGSTNVLYAILISIGAGLATGIGGAVAFAPSVLERFSPNVILSVALAISAGVMLYVSFIEIFVKAFEAILAADEEDEGKAAALTTFFFFLGMGFCVLLEIAVHRLDGSHNRQETHTDGGSSTTTADAKSVDVELAGTPAAAKEFFNGVDSTGHHCSAAAAAGGSLDDAESKAQLGRMGMLTGLAIALHNFPEGLATFLATVSDTSVGAALGTAIAIHNIPEGVCVAMPIYYATGNKRKAFLWALASGVTEPIGGILGYACLQPVFTDMVYGCVFAMVGGMMVFIVLHELLPTAHRYMPGRGGLVTGMLVLGMAIMSISLVLFTI